MSRKTLTTIPRSWGPGRSGISRVLALESLPFGSVKALSFSSQIIVPRPSCTLIFQVDNLKAVSEELRQRGWKPEGEQFEIPEGPCYRFNDPSGNPLALLQITRPNVLGITSEETE